MIRSQFSFLGKIDGQEPEWLDDIKEVLSYLGEQTDGMSLTKDSPGAIVFVDAHRVGLEEDLNSIERQRRAIFLVMNEEDAAKSELPDALENGWVDDVLIFPFRPLEVLSKLRHYDQLLRWDEVNDLNLSFSNLISRLKEDVDLAEKLQKRRVPERLPDLRGLKASSRYVAGKASGGDYFDLSENRSGSRISVVMTHSTSYGLSSAVLMALMKVTLQLGAESELNAKQTLELIGEDLVASMRNEDALSMFFGLIDKKTFKMEHVCFGDVWAWASRSAETKFSLLDRQPAPIGVTKGLSSIKLFQHMLQPKERLIFATRGAVNSVVSPDFLASHGHEDGVSLLNHFGVGVKGHLKDKELPREDASLMILDVESSLLRLA